jgi:hypothetical protein
VPEADTIPHFGNGLYLFVGLDMRFLKKYYILLEDLKTIQDDRPSIRLDEAINIEGKKFKERCVAIMLLGGGKGGRGYLTEVSFCVAFCDATVSRLNASDVAH